jgi:hypothetical protein
MALPPIVPWKFLVVSSTPSPAAATTGGVKSFAQILSPNDTILVSSLPIPCIRGESVSIKFTQAEYVRGVEGCCNNLHGRLVMGKGETPYTSRDLVAKLSAIWKGFQPWHLISLGRGYYELQFDCPDDKRKAWSVGAYNLRPGLLRLSKWTPDFNPFTQKL